MLSNPFQPSAHIPLSYTPACPASPPSEGRRRWTTGELTEIVAALAMLRTSDIARALGVNPKALRSVLRRHGISLRALREHGQKEQNSEGGGLLVRRSAMAPSAAFGAAAHVDLPDKACRWSFGDPAEPDFAFCGAAISGRSSYCPSHLAQAFQHDAPHVH